MSKDHQSHLYHVQDASPKSGTFSVVQITNQDLEYMMLLAPSIPIQRAKIQNFGLSTTKDQDAIHQ